MEFDFGFTTVDDPAPRPEAQDVSASVTAATEDFKDEIMAKLLDIEGRVLASDSSDTLNEHRELLKQDVAKKLRDLEDLTIPLLKNLQKNPEKEYIHWPNRVAIIDKQIEKIMAVTRFYERF